MHDPVNVHVHELRPAADVNVVVDVHVDVIGFFIRWRANGYVASLSS